MLVVVVVSVVVLSRGGLGRSSSGALRGSISHTRAVAVPTGFCQQSKAEYVCDWPTNGRHEARNQWTRPGKGQEMAPRTRMAQHRQWSEHPQWVEGLHSALTYVRCLQRNDLDLEFLPVVTMGLATDRLSGRRGQRHFLGRSISHARTLTVPCQPSDTSTITQSQGDKPVVSVRLAANGLGRARGQLLGNGERSEAHKGENLDSLHFRCLGESFRVEVGMKAIE